MTVSVVVMRMGLMGYMKALGLQNNLAESIKTNNYPFSGGALLLMEHFPVYTVGIRRKDYGPEYEEKLKSLGAEFVYTNRGGLVTFHGPGQLIVYPVLNLKMFKASMRWYVESLEEVVIKLCSEYSLDCGRSPHTGVWIGNNKLCAIGVHGSKFVTTHGLALNCSTDMTWFKHIVPCGIEGKGVTSLSNELNCNITPNDVIPRFLKCFQNHFNCEFHEDKETKEKKTNN